MVSSLAYLSLNPLLLTTSLLNESRTSKAALASGALSVSLAAEAQLEAILKLSKIKFSDSDDRLAIAGFTFTPFRLSGLPAIDGTLVSFDCLINHTFKGETSTLAVLSPIDFREGDSTLRPLIRYNRSYCEIQEIESESGESDSYPL